MSFIGEFRESKGAQEGAGRPILAVSFKYGRGEAVKGTVVSEGASRLKDKGCWGE